MKGDVERWSVERWSVRMFMKAQIILWVAVSSLGLTAFGQGKTLYRNDFEKTEVGQVPQDFLVLDGAFSVKDENGNRLLELPGAPVDSFGVQFGPAETDNIALSARIRSTAKGRRFPSFGVGLNGVAGYKLQLSPAKKMLPKRHWSATMRSRIQCLTLWTCKSRSGSRSSSRSRTLCWA